MFLHQNLASTYTLPHTCHIPHQSYLLNFTTALLCKPDAVLSGRILKTFQRNLLLPFPGYTFSTLYMVADGSSETYAHFYQTIRRVSCALKRLSPSRRFVVTRINAAMQQKAGCFTLGNYTTISRGACTNATAKWKAHERKRCQWR